MNSSRSMHNLFITGNYNNERFNVLLLFTKYLFAILFLDTLFLVASPCVTYAWFTNTGPELDNRSIVIDSKCMYSKGVKVLDVLCIYPRVMIFGMRAALFNILKTYLGVEVGQVHVYLVSDADSA